MKTKDPTYLTEKNLYTYLSRHYGESKIKKQFLMPNRTRIDYFLEDVTFNFKCDVPQAARIAIEFDGNLHYQQKKTINRDLINNEILKNNGVHVIHIPYWVQAEFIFPFYFNTTNPETFIGKWDKTSVPYPNGFIDKNCVRPIDFSIDGWNRFVYEICSYPSPIREDILNTMSNRENEIFETISRNSDEIFKLYDSVNWATNCMFG